MLLLWAVLLGRAGRSVPQEILHCGPACLAPMKLEVIFINQRFESIEKLAPSVGTADLADINGHNEGLLFLFLGV